MHVFSGVPLIHVPATPLPWPPHHAHPGVFVQSRSPSMATHAGQHWPCGTTSLVAVGHVVPVATHLLLSAHQLHSASTVQLPQFEKELQYPSVEYPLSRIV